jgi:hypothetical protein
LPSGMRGSWTMAVDVFDLFRKIAITPAPECDKRANPSHAADEG